MNEAIPCEDCSNKIGSPLDPCKTCGWLYDYQHFDPIPGGNKK